jgi:hypothetical protein
VSGHGDGTRWVFTYGRNSDLDRMRADAGGWQSFVPALLCDWAHTFTGRHVVFTGGTSTLVRVDAARTPGVAYLLDAEQADRFAGGNPGYHFVEATAVTADGGDEIAVAFLARPEVRPPNPPAAEYLEGIRAGLVQHFPPDEVDAHLRGAVRRAEDAVPTAVRSGG